MPITELDPNEIREIIETDDVKTAVLTPQAVEKYKKQIENCTAITVEGMNLRLNGFQEFSKEDGSCEAVMYLKINPELGQLQYAVSDHDDAAKIYRAIYPALVDMANQAGLILVDVRAVAAESIGSLKRAKGVTDTKKLIEILENEAEI